MCIRDSIFGEDRLRGRGSLPATFFYQAYFLWQTITAINSKRIKLLFAYTTELQSSQSLFMSLIPVSYTHLDVYKRQT